MSLLLIPVIALTASLIVLGVCAGMDLKDRLIPNELVIAVAVIGFAQGLVSRTGTVWLSLLAAVLVFFGLGILSHYKIIGGGDLKLISAVTLLVPPDRVGQLLLEIALAGGLLGLFYLAAHRWLKSLPASQSAPVEIASSTSPLAQMIRTERVRIVAGDSLPYALAVLGGVASYIAIEFYQCFSTTSCSL